ADLRADQCCAQWGIGGVGLQFRVGGLQATGTDEEGLLVLLIVVVVDVHDGADQGDAGLLWSFTDGGVVQQLLEVGDAGLFLALLLAGGVVATILLEVTLFAALIDLGGQEDRKSVV